MAHEGADTDAERRRSSNSGSSTRKIGDERKVKSRRGMGALKMSNNHRKGRKKGRGREGDE